MQKSSNIANKREQHRVELRAEKVTQALNLKRQKFAPYHQESNIIIQVLFYFTFF